MQSPTVSFIVPCYKLAHLLSECVNSILSQSFGDFEILIMDDCSPDNTAEVAQSFQDPRVKHIRNDPNLGALRNYNKGISLSRGKYVWLISADDYLRQPYVLHRHVELLETNPQIGYAFSPGVGVINGRETELLGYSVYSDHDEIIDGRDFVKKLLSYNMVLAPSALARRECYEKISFFLLDVVWAGIPVDMVWGGDWYLWLLFALYYDVGYFAEPLVCYREHELSMTNAVTQDKVETCWSAEMAVLWMIREKAEALGLRNTSRDCLFAIAAYYARHCVSKDYQWLDRSSRYAITIDQFEESLRRSTSCERERDWIRARVFTEMADLLYTQGDPSSARKLYLAGLRKDPLMTKVYAKTLLLLLGKPGVYARQFFGSLLKLN
jgi:glycosyltransferase involved in cell wall biosynthesis